jgi:hypothetical protein
MKNAPEKVSVDGIKIKDGVELWGIATLQPNGKYVCYANVLGHLCLIEITIHLKSELN